MAILNREDMTQALDDSVLKALKEIEKSLKDGSLIGFFNTDSFEAHQLPMKTYTFQISLLHEKLKEKEKKEGSS